MNIKFPPHRSSMHLTHNGHKGYYESIEKYLSDREDLESWANPTSRERAIATDELWELQWYPETPIGFHVLFGATLEEVLERAIDE